MSLQDYRDFKSWDEIHPGDILTWWREGEYEGYKIEFIKITSEKSILGKVIENPVRTTVGDVEGYGNYIYPCIVAAGWKVHSPFSEYDPTQVGDTDEDI
jgi:hypothetical protein